MVRRRDAVPRQGHPAPGTGGHHLLHRPPQAKRAAGRMRGEQDPFSIPSIILSFPFFCPFYSSTPSFLLSLLYILSLLFFYPFYIFYFYAFCMYLPSPSSSYFFFSLDHHAVRRCSHLASILNFRSMEYTE